MSKQFTIKGVIKFIDDNASKTIKAVDDRVAMLKKNTDRINKGGRQLGGAMLTLGAGGAVAGAGIFKAIQASAVFEKQMARVGALANASKEEMVLLENAALKLGGTTEFTATQAAQGLEFLALAGLNAKDSVGVLPTMLDAAAVGSMDLARASDVITDSMSALGAAFTKDYEDPAKRAVKMADLMAFAQSNSNTNIEQLGEAIKFGGGALAGFGIPLEQITSSFGALASAGLKGSMGGTSMMNMINKLSQPTKEVAEGMKLLGVDMNNLPLNDITKLSKMMGDALDKIKDPVVRGTAAVELFGLRGVRAFNALQTEQKTYLKLLKGSGKSVDGFTSRTAERVRKTFSFQFDSFKAGIERISIEIGNFFTKSTDKVIPTFMALNSILQDFGQALGFANQGQDAINKAMKDGTPQQQKLLQFAIGLKEGMTEAWDIGVTLFTSIKEGLKQFLPPGEEGTRTLGRMVAKFFILSAALAPLLVGLVTLGFAFTQLTGFITGPLNIIRGFAGILWPIAKFIIPKLITGFMMLAKVAIPAILGIGKALIAFMFSPMGLIIGGVIAVIAAGYLLYKYWDEIMGFLGGVTKSAIAGIVGTFQYLVDWFKNASFGEIIMKALLYPLRAALTPLMEIISFIANSKIAMKLIGPDAAKSIKSFADSVSLIPTSEELNKNRVVQPQSADMTAREIGQGSVLKETRTSQPQSASQEVGPINVQSPPLNFNIENVMQLDGKTMSRQMSKISTENSERAGMTNKSPKNRSLQKNGQFQPGFAR